MKAAIHHIGIYTADPVKLADFYEKKLGFERVAVKSVGKELMSVVFGISAVSTIEKMRFEDVILEVFSSSSTRSPAQPEYDRGINHWGLNVKDKTAFVQELEKKGVPVIKFEGQGKGIYFVKDPDGNLVEIYEDPERS